MLQAALSCCLVILFSLFVFFQTVPFFSVDRSLHGAVFKSIRRSKYRTAAFDGRHFRQNGSHVQFVRSTPSLSIWKSNRFFLTYRRPERHYTSHARYNRFVIVNTPIKQRRPFNIMIIINFRIIIARTTREERLIVTLCARAGRKRPRVAAFYDAPSCVGYATPLVFVRILPKRIWPFSREMIAAARRMQWRN